MPRISTADETLVRDAIAAAEKRCGGEIVCVVARSADRYLYIPTLVAALIAMGLPAVWVVVQPGALAAPISVAQILVFAALSFLFRWPPLLRRIIPGPVRAQRAGRLARETFFGQGLHLAPDRNGVLLFVAFAERHVEILADAGAETAIDNDDSRWAAVIDHMRPRLRSGAMGPALAEAIAEIAELLAERLPPRPARENALPDKLILL
ncbi:MAG: TPM domain-containing protein [Pseudomonadota bacterium]